MVGRLPPIDRYQLHDGDVVDLGEFRLKSKGYRFSLTGCQHRNCVIDTDAGTLVCSDCGVSVDPFSRLLLLAENRMAHMKKNERERARLIDMFQQVRNYRPHLRAAKALESIWRGRTMAPQCPHCRAALLPEDFDSDRTACVSATLERQRRKVRKGE